MLKSIAVQRLILTEEKINKNGLTARATFLATSFATRNKLFTIKYLQAIAA